jgi:bacterioferritin-associated ferredoxin
MYICICHAITDRQARAHCSSSCSVAAFYRALGVKPKCGKCVPLVREMLDAENDSRDARQNDCHDECRVEG